MTNFKTILGLVFVVQIGLASGLYLNKNSANEFDEAQVLIQLSNDSMSKISITSLSEDDGTEALTLKKSDNGWTIPSLENLPANQNKITEMVNKLQEVKVTWPVASSASSKKRFEVDEDQYQRKVTIEQGDSSKTLYLGTSPGYRSVHARVEGADEVYSVKLGTHDFPTNGLDWLDKGILQTNDVSQIIGPDFDIVQQEDSWQFAGPISNAADTLDTAKADELSKVFSSIRVIDLSRDATMENPVEINVKTPDGSYSYLFNEQDGKYYAKRSDLAPVFVISQADYEKITRIDRDELALKAADDSKASEAPADSKPLSSLENNNLDTAIAVDAPVK